MKKVLKLLEMAMELGDTPDAIHPHHKRALATGQHPLGKNPAFPPHAGQGPNPHERLASGSYKNIVDKLQRFGGHVPRNNRDTNQAVMDMFGSLQQIQRIEAAHTEQLEPLAIETVMRLPEFKSLRRPIQAGQLKIEAYLNRRIDIQGTASADEPQEPMPDAEVPEIQAEYDEMVHRRKMTNTLIHGAAVANNYAAVEHSFNELHEIDRRLANNYGKLMAYIELGYFIQSPEIMQAASQAGGTEAQGGEERLKRNDDGSVTIVARGITFPILVHEIVKGCMEFLSLNDEDDPETARGIRSHADVSDDEQIQMQVGQELYRKFIHALGPDGADLMPYVYDALNKLPTGEYNRIMQGLMNGTPEGQAWFQQTVETLRRSLGPETQGESLARKILGS